MQPREHLAALLWPESSAERSHASLRNTLGHLQTALRQASGQAQTSYLYITHNALGLNPEADIDLDLHTIEQAYVLARADRSSRALPEGSASLPLLQSAAACQRGDFLVGFSLGDAPGFDDWAAIQREVWHRRLGLILDRLSEIQFASGEFAGAAETASRWIALDALNEVAYRRKMRAHFAAGERGQALETYEACRAHIIGGIGRRARAGYGGAGGAHSHTSPPQYILTSVALRLATPARYFGCFSGKPVCRAYQRASGAREVL